MTRRHLFVSRFLVIGILICFAAAAAHSAEEKTSPQHSPDAAAQANNPLANMTAFNMQNYYIGELTESDDSANQFWFRFAKPISVAKTNWILRASLPVNTFPTPPESDRKPASVISISSPPT